MAYLGEEEEREIRKILSEMEKNVEIKVFVGEKDCPYCDETVALLQEVTALSDKLTLNVYDVEKDIKEKEDFDIKMVPAIVTVGSKDYGIRFFGIPVGYEFITLLSSIIDVSKEDSGLEETTKRELEKISEPVHIQVFVTPTCPYCPSMARLAHKMALESPMIKADVIEATEFQDLSLKYNIHSVPTVIINDKVRFEGAVSEKTFLDKILESNA
jgi:glutaredoxin-like protein